MKSMNPRMVILAIITLASLAALIGHPIISPDIVASLGGIGTLSFLMSGETSDAGIVEMLKKQGLAMQEFHDKYDEKLKLLNSDVLEISKKSNRPNLSDSNQGKKLETWIDTKSHQPIEILSHADLLKSGTGVAPGMGRVLRGLVLGGRAHDARELEAERKDMAIGNDPAGGYTVQGVLANEWIDTLRANMVLSKAGARTVPMEGNSLSLARVTGDPAISWHNENASLTAAQPTLGSVTLNAKTVVCLVKMSLELSQDSANIEQILQSTITQAMATAIDSAGLNGVNAGAAPDGILELAGRNAVTAIGEPTCWDFLTDGMYELMADNVPMDRIGALVAHPALWKKMRKLKTGITNDNTPLTMPQEIAALPKLWTTAAPTGTGIIADWRDLLFGVRKDITVRVLSETFLGTNLQIAVLAYARVDFAPTRVQSFCTLEGITV